MFSPGSCDDRPVLFDADFETFLIDANDGHLTVGALAWLSAPVPPCFTPSTQGSGRARNVSPSTDAH